MKVRNITSVNGNKIANQFIIEGCDKVYFQSYNSIIACIDYYNRIITIGKDFDYSITTGKYRNKFFNDEGFYEVATLADIRKAIDNGFADINNTRYSVVYDVNL